MTGEREEKQNPSVGNLLGALSCLEPNLMFGADVNQKEVHASAFLIELSYLFTSSVYFVGLSLCCIGIRLTSVGLSVTRALFLMIVICYK